jgi:hypothetical protein
MRLSKKYANVVIKLVKSRLSCFVCLVSSSQLCLLYNTKMPFSIFAKTRNFVTFRLFLRNFTKFRSR